MIEAIRLLRNIGTFDSVTSGAQLPLGTFALVYAENGRGKTTLSSILRSLRTGGPSAILERRRLGAANPPHAVIALSGGATAVFENGAWSSVVPEIAVFDDHFVADNVCAGMEVVAEHRQNLHELIIGSQGVALNADVQVHVQRIEEHNRLMQEKAGRIPADARGRPTVDAFCALEQRDDIEDAIGRAERNLAAGREAEAIRQQHQFSELALPNFDTAGIEALLARDLPALETEAAARVQAHLANLGERGETWVAEGMQYIGPASAGHEREICPFCAQELDGSALIAHYQEYFSEAYGELRQAIDRELDALTAAHSGEIVAAFERAAGAEERKRTFWSRFMEVPAIKLDTAAIALGWKTAFEAVAELLRKKQAAPLERLELGQRARAAIASYQQTRDSVAALSGTLQATAQEIELVKERAAAADIPALESDLAGLKAVRERHRPEIAALCDEYLQEKEAKRATEALRDAARAALDQYRDVVFPAYQNAINDYLQRLNAGFRLDQVSSANIRAGSTCNYSVLIEQVAVPITANVPNEPSFRTTLSAGDRNALALAFFFASLEHDAGRAQKIVIIDDPMTSLDEHRSLTTLQELRRLANEVAQVIVLSHSKPFLCSLWRGADENGRSVMRIVRAQAGSTFATWDVNQDCITEHDRHHALVRGYIDNSVGVDERAVAAALRPILESFVRVAYPELFPPGAMLGPFIGISQQREGTPQQILSPADSAELRALLDYANLFHHNTNPGWQTEIINDHELLDFARRTLAFASRP